MKFHLYSFSLIFFIAYFFPIRLQGQKIQKKEMFPSWNKKECAVVLTYDDAINVDLDNVFPILDSLKIRATFYLIGSSPVVHNRMEEWRKLAKEGNELGNHSLFHPCDGLLPGRSFINQDNDLSRYTVNRAVNEIKMNNTLLKALDGKETRTFAYPCGDLKIGNNNFYDSLKNDFAGARGVKEGFESLDKIDLNDIHCFFINGQSSDYMIDLVNKALQDHTLLVFLFHGVGGGHNLNVGLKDHSRLLHYLKENENRIWIAPLVEVAEFIKKHKS